MLQGCLRPEGTHRPNEEDVCVKQIVSHPGPFTTPHTIYKTIRFSLRGQAQEVRGIMEDFTKDGLGRI